MPVLEVEDLAVSFRQYSTGLRQTELKVIHGLHLSIEPGEITAVFGASGSGKSLLAHAVLGILPGNATVTGEIRFDGVPLTRERQETLRGREIALVPQSVNYLDPLMRVGKQVEASVCGASRSFRLNSVLEVFKRYKLGPDTAGKFPFQLSGGMARRVLVSTATLSGARLIIADEPTPGLDAEALAEALRLFKQLAQEGCAVMLISHDIEAALQIADKVAVFYAGTTVEVAAAGDFSGDGSRLRHPYTRALWNALPQNKFAPIPGVQPHPNAMPPGCLFAPRCSLATGECAAARPAVREIRGGKVSCLHVT
ncbi:ABC transporter ATP-binding protein [Paenibacillus piri]|uniref:Nickel import system ATP-binding protein NikD n=1 Tax=Paenibacillus piri TaxID=2547395 RepID=A0A4V2ZT51_9BACL|nr:ABC transporter ATP-binding protein [Paenibacillus piri]TDF95764.1 ABC transporter ATP-binding protein [Paenibacillus piri]